MRKLKVAMIIATTFVLAAPDTAFADKKKAANTTTPEGGTVARLKIMKRDVR